MSVYTGDIGTIINIDVADDISTFTTLEIKYKDPDGTTGTWTAVLGANDTSLEYTVTSGDLNISGVWTLQAYIVLPTWSGYSTTATLEVLEEIA